MRYQLECAWSCIIMINCSLFLSLSLSIIFLPLSLSLSLSLSCNHFVARFVNKAYVVFKQADKLNICSLSLNIILCFTI